MLQLAGARLLGAEQAVGAMRAVDRALFCPDPQVSRAWQPGMSVAGTQRADRCALWSRLSSNMQS